MAITHVTIVTGASRGLGEALTQRLLAPNHQLVCLARKRNEALLQQAATLGVQLTWVEQDLAELTESGGAEAFMKELLSRTAYQSAAHIRLINNAGMLDPIGAASSNASEDVARHIAVNLTAPLVLSAAFLRETEHLSSDKRLMQISSGAGRHPYAGWSAYCATKAGLDHFSRCVKLEQEGLPHGARIASVAPGVIDTAMQATIRSAGEERFPSHARFVEMYETGSLTLPQEAAGKLIAYLEDDRFGEEVIADIRNW
ncbi:benzil reductase ((S)-benzoin forming) [Paenibacillus phyllosphaerae]|uniref:Benzil reductase ((S)-benzoin forming) n=1 Tax=Paenibacillus phyllosphaerae TaxID=274593 RepID=A0A7W5AYW3_9BACL|nr:SDR family oxidoreductase [Paenibacillus phyllosphaerae]MBB3111152.1 benzil reductase ((S)-benzoin forming) [Paenibacillus phyllosphaerae]